jgi:two-component system chemotaxis sensor kinase CheA
LLNGVRKGDYSLTRGTVDLLLSVVDGLEELLRRIDPHTGQSTPVDTSRLVEALRAVQGVGCMPDCVETDSGFVASPALTVAPGVDPEDVIIFEQTVTQQLENMSLALSVLNKEPGNRDYIDGLYRSLSSLQNSAAYMNQEDLRVYAERTAGLVGQARDTGLDFSLMVGMLEQEVSILEDMVTKSLAALKSGPPVGAAPVVAAAGQVSPSFAAASAERAEYAEEDRKRSKRAARTNPRRHRPPSGSIMPNWII